MRNNRFLIAAHKPSPAWRERVLSVSEAGEGERAGYSCCGPSGAPTLTRLALLATLSRHAGEGLLGPAQFKP